MSKNNEKIEEIEEKIIKCPRCNQEIDHVIKYRGSGFMFCPNCGSSLPRSAVPINFPVELRESKRGLRKRQISESDEEEEGVSLFEKPKPPHIILREVLEDYNVNPDFIAMMVRRSKTLGGIHPTELQMLLRRMKSSGVKDDDTAAWIAQDYALRLQKEQEKARQQGIQISYPLTQPSSTPALTYPYPASPYPQSSTTYPSPPQQYRPQYPYQYQYQQPYQPFPQQQPLTYEDVRRIIKEETEEKKREERILQLEKEITELKSNLPNLITQAIKENIPPQPQIPANVATKEDLVTAIKEAIKEKDTSDYIKYLEKKSEDEAKRAEEYRKALAEERKFWTEKLDEIRREIPRRVAEYKADEYKIADTTIREAVEVLRKKEPLKTIIEGLHKLLTSPYQPHEKPRPKETKESETEIEKLLPSDFIEEGEESGKD